MCKNLSVCSFHIYFVCLCTVIFVLGPQAIAVCAQVIQNDCVNFMLIVSFRAIKVKSPHYKSLLGGHYSFKQV